MFLCFVFKRSVMVKAELKQHQLLGVAVGYKEEIRSSIGRYDLIDIYRTFYLKPARQALVSKLYQTFPKIDDILGHKTHFNILKELK